MKRYTIIYGEWFNVGSQRHSIVKLMHLETDDLQTDVQDKIGWENVHFVLDGHCEETKD